MYCGLLQRSLLQSGTHQPFIDTNIRHSDRMMELPGTSGMSASPHTNRNSSLKEIHSLYRCHGNNSRGRPAVSGQRSRTFYFSQKKLSLISKHNMSVVMSHLVCIAYSKCVLLHPYYFMLLWWCIDGVIH